MSNPVLVSIPEEKVLPDEVKPGGTIPGVNVARERVLPDKVEPEGIIS